MRLRQRHRGFTLAEILTVAVVIVVLAAIAIPTYRTHLLRVRRTEASAALLAIQAAQDRYFGRNARYAGGDGWTKPEPEGLGLKSVSERGYYRFEVEATFDGLGYRAVARAIPASDQSSDTRCVELSIDQNGQRRAVDADGADRSGDCWR